MTDSLCRKRKLADSLIPCIENTFNSFKFTEKTQFPYHTKNFKRGIILPNCGDMFLVLCILSNDVMYFYQVSRKFQRISSCSGDTK